MIGLESDLLSLVKAETVFHAPILAAFTIPKLITDPLVLDRIGYNRLPQNTNKPETLTGPSLPFLTWSGPHNYDQGQVADGASGTKKADFWFKLYHQTMTQAMSWANDIEPVLLGLTYPYDLSVFRLTASFLIDKFPVPADQVQVTSKEYPLVCATIGYTFGFQLK